MTVVAVLVDEIGDVLLEVIHVTRGIIDVEGVSIKFALIVASGNEVVQPRGAHGSGAIGHSRTDKLGLTREGVHVSLEGLSSRFGRHVSLRAQVRFVKTTML